MSLPFPVFQLWIEITLGRISRSRDNQINEHSSFITCHLGAQTYLCMYQPQVLGRPARASIMLGPHKRLKLYNRIGGSPCSCCRPALRSSRMCLGIQVLLLQKKVAHPYSQQSGRVSLSSAPFVYLLYLRSHRAITQPHVQDRVGSHVDGRPSLS
jgi:hypothetical protein